ncbi:pesticin C-terminus-like muramidase, partial [Vibrio cionasavignyae]|uniref:pesticin C-terminus-like muramidase n=1 Tax=Vibrio cionasavignyae TaxID=2910252 RepID=UPI003D11B9EC
GDGEALSNGSKGLEVKVVQEALIELGFDLGPAGADGDFGKATESAIKQFQKGYEPTHNTHETYKIGEVDGIVDKNTALALDESVSENWQYVDDEMDEKWLTVPIGQLTFDSEGNDIFGSIYFSRLPHVPNTKGVVIGESGITFGRGLDLGSRNQVDVEQIFSNVRINCKPLSHSLLEWLKEGAGLKGQNAYNHYKNIDDQVPKIEQELTRKQQHFLFLEIYPSYVKETERLLTKADVRSFFDKESVIVWSELPRNIREVLVDITYRGDNRSSSRKMNVPSLVTDINDKLSGSKSKFYLLMKDKKVWVDNFKVDNNRYKARYKALLK